MTISSRYQCPECGGFDWQASSDSVLESLYVCNNDSCGVHISRLVDSEDAEKTEDYEKILTWVLAGVEAEAAGDYYAVEKAGIRPHIWASIRECDLTTITQHMKLAHEQLEEIDIQDEDLV